MADLDPLRVGTGPAVLLCNSQTRVQREPRVGTNDRIPGDQAAFDFRNTRGAGIRGQGGATANSSGAPEQHYYGVWGDAQNDNPERDPRTQVPRDFSVGKGVRGTSRTGIGVDGSTTTGIGVRGLTAGRAEQPFPTLDEAAVIGRSNEDMGVVGSSNSSYGVMGFSFGIEPPVGGPITVFDRQRQQIGVRGHGGDLGVGGTSFRGAGIGGYSESNAAVWGHGPNQFGVLGFSENATGVRGDSWAANGVVGMTEASQLASGVFGFAGARAIGVAGRNDSPDGWAGHFIGKVEVLGKLEKPGGGFKIDHPRAPANMYLNHSFVESSEMKNIYDGIAHLGEDGAAWVTLPKWFEALNKDFRYQLTAIGGSAPELHIAEEVSEGRFRIAGGKEGMKVSWQLTGVRKDKWAEANPLEVAQEKPEEERGRYLQPELYDAPEEQRIVIGPPIPEPIPPIPGPIEVPDGSFARAERARPEQPPQAPRAETAEEWRSYQPPTPQPSEEGT